MKGAILSLFLITTITAVAQKNYKTQLTHANVYFGYGAELNHTAKATLEKGTQEITFENISTTLDQNSVQISVPENVVLLSYRFNARTIVSNTPNPSIKRMEDSLKLLNKLIASVTNEANLTSELLEKTSKLIEIYSNGGNKNTTITTADLIKLLDFYTSKIQSYRTTLFAIQVRREEYNGLVYELSNRMYAAKQDNGGNAAKVVGEMVLQLMAQNSTTADVGISYFTQNAGWIPTYDMRVESENNTFKLGYKASINQTTGLDWKQVKLTLSTSNPNQGNSYPTLNPLVLQMFNPEMYNNLRGNAAAKYNYNRAQSLQEVVVTTADGYSVKDDDKEVEEKADVSDYLTLNQSQLNTSFEIALPYDIPTDGKRYSVAIKEEKLNATYKHYAIPKLDKDAFLLAEISDWESLDLLPGEANIIMDNVYLGKSFIDPNTTMDTLNLSLGRDKRVAVRRLLVKEFSKSKIKGDNKTETFTYEITVKNNKSKEMAMLLKDQFPISNIKEVVVKLDEKDGAEVNEELGTLNWTVKLKPGESKKYRFSYTVTYPKDKKIANLR